MEARQGPGATPGSQGRRQNGSMSATVSTAHWVRAVGNAVNLSTVLGLGLCWVGRARLRRGPDLLLVADGYRLPLPKAAAFTVGNVVLVPGATLDAVESRSPGTLAHEAAHSWQYFGLLGVPFLPLYAAAAGWSWLRTGDPASANWFERRAGLVRGGYVEHPIDNTGFRRIRSSLRMARKDEMDRQSPQGRGQPTSQCGSGGPGTKPAGSRPADGPCAPSAALTATGAAASRGAGRGQGRSRSRSAR